MDLDEEQRAANLLRSVNPESFRTAEYVKRICEQAVEEVVQGFAGLLRYCPTLGPETQEVLRCNLDRLIERLGLTCEVYRALEAPGDQPHEESWLLPELECFVSS